MTAAENIIEKLGGVSEITSELSELMGKSINMSTIYRWTYPKPKGTGGEIPKKYHDYLLDIADKKGIDIDRVELFNIDN